MVVGDTRMSVVDARLLCARLIGRLPRLSPVSNVSGSRAGLAAGDHIG